MPSDPADRLRNAYAAFNSGAGLDWSLIDPSIEHDQTKGLFLDGVFYGPEGVRGLQIRRGRQLDGLPTAGDGHGTGLTGAELRLLPLLATHLSFREIGERLYVSRNTIKTQAISVYRKLGVSSRSDAIERASSLGLVDSATPGRSAFTPDG